MGEERVGGKGQVVKDSEEVLGVGLELFWVGGWVGGLGGGWVE